MGLESKVTLIALVKQAKVSTILQPGDTSRIRDRHTPYIDVDIKLSRGHLGALLSLNKLRILKFGESISANQYDEFSVDSYLAGSNMKGIGEDSIITIKGPFNWRIGRPVTGERMEFHDGGTVQRNVANYIGPDEMSWDQMYHWIIPFAYVGWDNVGLITPESENVDDEFIDIFGDLKEEGIEFVKDKYFT